MKKKFIWDNTMSVGNGLIDSQHKKLIELANLTMQIDLTHLNKDDFKKLFLELANYTQTHFKDEEKWMKEINYPEIEKHIGIHEQIIEKLNNSLKKSNSLEDLYKNLYDLLNEWVVLHIKEEDMNVKLWCEKKGLILSLEKIS